MKYCFGDIVVVQENLIGVVVKSFGKGLKYNAKTGEHEVSEPNYDVYVRYRNSIINYNESEIERYMVRHKYLSDEELEWQRNAIEE